MIVDWVKDLNYEHSLLLRSLAVFIAPFVSVALLD